MEIVKDKVAVETPIAEHNGTHGTTPPEEHPLTRVIGGFADDPLWDEFLQEMEQSRREIDQKHGLVE